MDIDRLFYNSAIGRERFELEEGRRPWNLILILCKGSFECKLNCLEEGFTAKGGEIIYFPANVKFKRKLLSPITFHQFAFQTDMTADPARALTPGKLNIPPDHVATIAENIDIISRNNDSDLLFGHMIENIIIENYIRSREASLSLGSCSEDILFILEYMRAHMTEKIDVDLLAEKIHLSHVGLIWKFKQQLGLTPMEYLIMIRLRHAKELLIESKMMISEIAQSCGYSSQYYFSNAFKKSFGMSPSEFRKIHIDKK